MSNTATEQLIKQLIQRPEREVVEFKLNNSDPTMMGERISGLANGACLEGLPFAYLIYGISDERSVEGTTFQPHEEKIGNEPIMSWLANRMSPKIDFRVREIMLEEKRLVLLEIPSATIQPVTFNRVAFVRVSSANRRLSDFPDKERQIWRNAEKYFFEKEIALANVTGDMVMSLLDFSAYFDLFKITPTFEKEKVLERFVIEGFIVPEGTSVYSITNLGAILFGKDLTRFDRLDRKRPRIIIYKGFNRIETVKELTGTKGYALGFEGMIGYINDQLPANEEIGKAFRKEVKMYPDLAIRELVANAIIHQDFSITGAGPLVEVFDDRVEITNPGVSLIDTLRFIDHAPQSRNEKLASVMRRLNICEERGSGVDKVVGQCEVFQLPAPDFYQGDNYLRVTLYAAKELRDMDKKDKIRACYQHCCLKWVSNDFMTNQSLRERFQIEDRNYAIASRIISDTIDAGLIKSADEESRSNRYAKYAPVWS